MVRNEMLKLNVIEIVDLASKPLALLKNGVRFTSI